MPAAAASAMNSPPFALLIPGRTLQTGFAQVDANKMMIQVPAPLAVTELTICMLQPTIRPDQAVAIYFAVPPFNESDQQLLSAHAAAAHEWSANSGEAEHAEPVVSDCLLASFCRALLCLLLRCSWQYLGSISLAYPSASFRPVWRDKIPPDTPALGIGLSVESAQAVSQLAPADAREEERTMDSARGIAKNLYEFMASYSQNTGSVCQSRMRAEAKRGVADDTVLRADAMRLLPVLLAAT